MSFDCEECGGSEKGAGWVTKMYSGYPCESCEDSEDSERSSAATNPLLRRIQAYVRGEGYNYINAPYITQVAANLWHGGCTEGLVLPENIDHVISLYTRESYTVNHQLLSTMTVRMLDSTDQGMEQVDILAQWVNLCRTTGNVLVSCQAGVNRSSLIIARALMYDGYTASEAIDLIREKRSPVCLANRSFEDYLRAIPRTADTELWG